MNYHTHIGTNAKQLSFRKYSIFATYQSLKIFLEIQFFTKFSKSNFLEKIQKFLRLFLVLELFLYERAI